MKKQTFYWLNEKIITIIIVQGLAVKKKNSLLLLFKPTDLPFAGAGMKMIQRISSRVPLSLSMGQFLLY